MSVNGEQVAASLVDPVNLRQNWLPKVHADGLLSPFPLDFPPLDFRPFTFVGYDSQDKHTDYKDNQGLWGTRSSSNGVFLPWKAPDV